MKGLLGAVALVCVLAVGSPAASAVPLLPVGWPAISCAKGELILSPPSTPAGPVYVFGWIQPCPDARIPYAQFAVVYYHQTNAVHGVLHRYADDPNSPTDIQGRLNPGMLGSLQAVCLAYSPSGRLSCYGVHRDATGVLGFTHIDTDDPRVTVPLSAPPIGSGEIGTTCATCV
ncbi:hypothetical protein K1W54_15585 [Micromonospora sp. CPCC 205371]|nr:hypothetical protein [Micromonospora sp. CPCC 205371]